MTELEDPGTAAFRHLVFELQVGAREKRIIILGLEDFVDMYILRCLFSLSHQHH